MSEGKTVNVEVPALGESISEATVGKWQKKEGDFVQTDEVLLELETDKVSIEVRAQHAGCLVNIQKKEGDVVDIGATLAFINIDVSNITTSESSTTSSTKPDIQIQQSLMPSQISVSKNSSNNDDDMRESIEAEKSKNDVFRGSPSVRRLVQENNLDTSKLLGTGPKGTITKGDIISSMINAINSGKDTQKTQTNTENKQDFLITQKETKNQEITHPFQQEEERVRMTRLRQTIAKRLKEAQNTAAILTTFNELDMTNLMRIRASYKSIFEAKHRIKLGYMGFFVKACVQALKEIPAINASIDGNDIVYKNYYNVGVAVGTEKGLVVPVIKNAHNMGIEKIEKTIAGFALSARENKLSIEDLRGGTFTISNGGIYGSLMSTPILNTPQSGVLGMHKIQERPVVIDGEIKIRSMMYLALSYDHRIVDGKDAVIFLIRVKELLEDPNRFVLNI